MGFVGNQDNFVPAKIFVGEGVFFLCRQVGVEFLNGRKANVEVIGVRAFEILHRRDAHAAIGDGDFGGEKILNGRCARKGCQG